MAIQIWDAQAGQYKSADLARFGGSGTLKEALVWDGTQYVKVWPTGPTYTWYDDFTSPTLHSRWSILAGTYSPPGLSGAYLTGPTVDDSFEIDITREGGTQIYVGADDLSHAEAQMTMSDNGVDLMVGSAIASCTGVAPPTLTLRRQSGTWTALADGTPLPRDGGGVLQIEDTTTGAWHLILDGFYGTIHSVGYRKL